MKIGDLVCYIEPNNKVTGLITKINGKKWFKVRWNDGVILNEHKGDIKLTKEVG